MSERAMEPGGRWLASDNPRTGPKEEEETSRWQE